MLRQPIRTSHLFSATLCAAMGLGLAIGASARTAQTQPRTLFVVTVAPGLVDRPVSGRLIVFLAKGAEVKADEKALGPSFVEPESVFFTGLEVHNLEPGKTVEVRSDQLAYPTSLADAPAGAY